jgi:hypothetical protein
MTTLSTSAQIMIRQAMQSLRDFFPGKDIVTRAQVLDFIESTGEKVPTAFWTATKVGRGVHSLDAGIIASVPEQQTRTVEQETDDELPSNVICRFDEKAMVPLANPNYVEWGPYKQVKALVEKANFFTLYISGPSGSGKNEMLENICASLNKPLVRVGCSRDTKEEQLIGTKTLIDGNIVYEVGPVVWAAETGAVLCIDELSVLDPGEAMCLQQAMEGKPFFVKSANRLVVPKEGFIVIATDNTKGRGDSTGRYIGTTIQNDAFLERFMVTFEMEYAPEKVEANILSNHIKYLRKSVEISDTDKSMIEKLNKWIQVIRKSFKEEAIEELITTRRALFILNTYVTLGKMDDAIELCTNRFDETTKEAFIKLWEGLK